MNISYVYVLIFRVMYLLSVSQATLMEFAAFNAIMYVCTCASMCYEDELMILLLLLLISHE